MGRFSRDADRQKTIAFTTSPITRAIRTQSERTAQGEHSSPLYLTSSFCFDDAEEMRAAFADETDDNIYSRFSNPTVSALAGASR